uniref:BTB/POZ domain-containing protein 19 isoform X3 n=1 Tax=Jaculus jaculus TaxID=51337 RepID=UPI001E1B2C6D|nr:BTB/POZ domain-containing protein 19 isoform X3 [Jaculus jaculus]
METSGLVVHGQDAPFSTALRSLVNNPWYSDVRFVVGQERQEVFAHRCLLACRCNFFQRLLGTEPGPGVPSPVVLSTVPAEAFLAVLEFLYTNSVKLHRQSVSPSSRGLGGKDWGYKWQKSAYPAVSQGVRELPSAPLSTHSAGAGGADSGCGVRARRIAKGSGNLWPEAPAGAVHSLHRGPQPVLERPVAEVAAPVVPELRLALLAPAELSALEEQNRREPLIPVRTQVTRLISTSQRGDKTRGLAQGLSGEGPCLDCVGTSFSCRWSRSWRRGSATPCGEETQCAVPRAAAGGAPCLENTTDFWTFLSSNPIPRPVRHLPAQNYSSRRALRLELASAPSMPG